MSEKLNSEMKEQQYDFQTAVLFHGSPTHFKQFELKNERRTGRALGFGIYLTDDKDRAETFSGESGFLYEVNANVLDGRGLSDEQLTLSEKDIYQLVCTISEYQMASEEAYPYYLSDYGEVSSETTMDYGNQQIAKEISKSLVDHCSDDLSVINSIYWDTEGDFGDHKGLAQCLSKQNIKYGVKNYVDQSGDQDKHSKEYIIFDPKSIEIFRTVSMQQEKLSERRTFSIANVANLNKKLQGKSERQPSNKSFERNTR